jgi:hypothetical protein
VSLLEKRFLWELKAAPIQVEIEQAGRAAGIHRRGCAERFHEFVARWHGMITAANDMHFGLGRNMLC